MDGSYSLVVEGSPDPAELVALEERVACRRLRDRLGRMLRTPGMWVMESVRGRGLARALIAALIGRPSP